MPGEETAALESSDRTQRSAAELRARRAWAEVAARVRSITPSGFLRFVFVAATLLLLGRLVWTSWVQLTPFMAGLALAYITAPLVNLLDQLLPRGLAVLLVILLEIVGFLLLVGLLIPALADQLTRLVGGLPEPAQLQQALANLAARARTLPEPVRQFIREGLRQAALNIRSSLIEIVRESVSFSVLSVFTLIRTFGFILGFLVLPTWLYAVLMSSDRGTRLLFSVVPSWMRDDLWALARIVDRALGVFLRGLLVQGLVTGVLVYCGLVLLRRFGWPGGSYEYLLATTAGVLELIPVAGPILAALLAVGLALTVSARAALTMLVLYIIVQLLVVQFVAPWVQSRVRSDLHPAVMVVAVVILSQFGLLWTLLSVPLAVIFYDLFRYIYGRLGDPPRPAGMLPGDPLPAKRRRTHKVNVYG